MADAQTDARRRAGLGRREFLTRAVPARVGALLGSGAVAATATGAEGAPPADVSARDLKRMSRAEVREALRRIRQRRRSD